MIIKNKLGLQIIFFRLRSKSRMDKQKSILIRSVFIIVSLLLSFSGYCATVNQKMTAETGNYHLGPEDELEISIWNEDKLARKVLVRPDGRFSFPLAGEIQASGMTPDQVRKEIANKISKYIPDPVVTVMVTEVASYKIYVIGQVKKAGIFAVGRYVDVIQALAMAGGLTPFASEDNMKILRTKKGKHTVISFNYSEIKKGRKLGQLITLQSGDVIVVP